MKKITLLAALALAAIPSMSTAMPEKDAVSGSKSTAAGLMRVGATVTNAQIIADKLQAEAENKQVAKSKADVSNELRVVPAPSVAGHTEKNTAAGASSSGSIAIKVSVKPKPADANQAVKDAVAAAVAGGDAPVDTPSETWADIDETERYLLIMGNADGFSAAGPGAPCFPGKSNSDLNNELITNSFADKPTEELTEALASLSEDKASCAQAPLRGYTVDLIKTMSDEHIAIYLTGLVRGYSHSKACPVENHQYAAGTVTAAIFAADPGAQPVGVIAEAMAKGCEGIEASAEHSS